MQTRSKPEAAKVRRSVKVWRTLEATGLLALGSLVACTADEQPHSGEGTPSAAHSASLAGEGEGEGRGEGEGTGEGEGLTAAIGEGEGESSTAVLGEGAGEGEGAMNAALTAADDVAYLTQIGLMRGHLWVGHQLQQNGLHNMALTHMKHPKAELYSTLVTPFEARGVEGFSDELSTLADAVAQKTPQARLDATYDELKAAIARSEQGANTQSPKIIGEVIVALLRTAGEEYAIGVVDGKINNLHEYQDALGFTTIADRWARSPAFANPAAATAAAARIQTILSELAPMWPGLNPDGVVPFQAAQLYGAAARIEIEILGL